jgi:peptidoglycan/LPS O-acetylase OafA/YrhL
MKHLPALDGVRGIAILAVILFHYTYLSCGWAGVQLFFVLSGYLITSILVADSDLPAKLYFQRFYWRRTLRISPSTSDTWEYCWPCCS